jgi:hypothetical protein
MRKYRRPIFGRRGCCQRGTDFEARRYPDFSFRTPDHELVKLDVSQWREAGKFKLKQDEFTLYREGALQVYMFWLVLMMWNRDDAAAS